MIFKYLIKLYKVRFSSERTLYLDLKQFLGEYPNQLTYYLQAFTHRSAVRANSICGENNERLEYLGDAILGAVVADYLYTQFPKYKEGALTQMRSRLVNRMTLSQVALHHHLEKHLIAQIHLPHECKYIYSNMMEAIIGAIYLDKGYKFTYNFIINKLLKDFLKDDIALLEHDFKSRILEWAQKRRHHVEFITRQDVDPTSRLRFFISIIMVDKKEAGQGKGDTKKDAEKEAARLAWKTITKR